MVVLLYQWKYHFRWWFWVAPTCLLKPPMPECDVLPPRTYPQNCCRKGLLLTYHHLHLKKMNHHHSWHWARHHHSQHRTWQNLSRIPTMADPLDEHGCSRFFGRLCVSWGGCWRCCDVVMEVWVPSSGCDRWPFFGDSVKICEYGVWYVSYRLTMEEVIVLNRI